MLDAYIDFFHPGFDAQVYILCIGGVIAHTLFHLTRSVSFSDFIGRLAHQLAYLSAVAGIGLLILAFLRFASTTERVGDNVALFYIVTALAFIVSFAPFIAYRISIFQTVDVAKLEENTPVLFLPSPDAFTDEGSKP